MNILFVCNQNEHRSPTAECIFKDHEGVCVRSAGLYDGSKVLLDRKLLEWADVVFVMEEEQKEEIKQRFPECRKNIIVLDIPDIYSYMDERLIILLKERTKQFFS